MESGYEFQYWFGPFCLDPNRRLLLRNGERLPLTAKSLATLVALVERAGVYTRFAELAARTGGGLNLNRLTELADEARKAGYIELDLEIRLVQAEQAASSGRRVQALRLAAALRSEAARRGYGGVAARAARVAANRS